MDTVSSTMVPSSVTGPVSRVVSRTFVPTAYTPVAEPSSLQMAEQAGPSNTSGRDTQPLPPGKGLTTFASGPFSFTSFSIGPAMTDSKSLGAATKDTMWSFSSFSPTVTSTTVFTS